MPRIELGASRVSLVVAVVALLCGRPALATPVLTFNEASGMTAGNGNQSVGWRFDVLSPIGVTGLGWFDEGADGLFMAHRVGIWAPDGTLLIFADVPSGLGAPLDGQFRTVTFPSLVLGAGAGYIVGGENFSTNTERLASSVAHVVDSRISYDGATFSSTGVGFQRPTLNSIATTGFYGPSFSVAPVEAPIPEPTTMLLLGGGLAGLALRRRRP